MSAIALYAKKTAGFDERVAHAVQCGDMAGAGAEAAFGTVAETAGLSGIPRTISLAPFATEAAGLHFAALGIFLSLALAYIDSAARLRRMANVIIIFGAVFAFFAILQSVLSPTKIYGIFERPSPFGSFVNRHNFAAYIEMTASIWPSGIKLSELPRSLHHDRNSAADGRVARRSITTRPVA